MMGCSQTNSRETAKSDDQVNETTVPASASEATALLLESTDPSPAVDQALDLISEYEDKSMRLQDTIKVADGSLHISLEQRYPKLGILVYHYDQKFTRASRIPEKSETSNQ
jgi:hypothetical protein